MTRWRLRRVRRHIGWCFLAVPNYTKWLALMRYATVLALISAGILGGALSGQWFWFGLAAAVSVGGSLFGVIGIKIYTWRWRTVKQQMRNLSQGHRWPWWLGGLDTELLEAAAYTSGSLTETAFGWPGVYLDGQPELRRLLYETQIIPSKVTGLFSSAGWMREESWPWRLRVRTNPRAVRRLVKFLHEAKDDETVEALVGVVRSCRGASGEVSPATACRELAAVRKCWENANSEERRAMTALASTLAAASCGEWREASEVLGELTMSATAASV